MGDGFLAWLPPAADPVPVVASVAAGCVRPDGQPWRLRAASHIGHPIRHNGDLFGNDVNLVARLCEPPRPASWCYPTEDGSPPEDLSLRGSTHRCRRGRVAIP